VHTFVSLTEWSCLLKGIILYPVGRDLPLTHTLRSMTLKAVSIGWMMSRQFPKLTECKITSPQHLEAFYGGTSLPACMNFSYNGRKPFLLSYLHMPLISSLTIKNEMWNKRQGSRELGASLLENIRQWINLRVLHLETQCHSEVIILMLSALPRLEGLILSIVRPNALGKMFFTAVMAGPSESSDSSRWSASLCPKLQTLGLHYRRWYRKSEVHATVSILKLREIVESRRKTSTPLQSLHIWFSTSDEEGVEICTDEDGPHRIGLGQDKKP
jgi:hypothetical protein